MHLFLRHLEQIQIFFRDDVRDDTGGEETGKLSDMLLQVALFYEEKLKIKQKIVYYY